ncbi:MAG: thiamine-phosphate kinase, partial [Betaproteobacteria bacterium]|nr:thiamine-phosphate kinase [Betaproteobacteria bacterium]
VRAPRGREIALTTDMLVGGRHFFADADPERLGHKALAVNLSDLAAMGAAPRWATLALALPRVDARWLAAFSRGFLRLARRHGVELIGGDTTRGPLAVCVQIAGEVPAGRALRRDGARMGDDIWVSGTLGDAALALAALKRKIALSGRERALLERRLHAPAPRVALGMALRGVARSAIDVSDGLVADLGHVCERSGLAAVIEAARIPLSPVVKSKIKQPVAMNAVLSGGDDYELVFTAGRTRRRAIARLSRRLRLRLTRIGRIIRRRRGGSLVTVLGDDGGPVRLPRAGFDHFG